MTGPSRRVAAMAVVIVVVAFLLRAFRIGDQELWYDEAFSFHMATIQTGLWDALRIENSPPFYYLLLRAWVAIAGVSEAAVRLPSALIGTLGVATVIAAGWRFFNYPVGLWAGAIMAISPIHIYYSQEARGYALLVCALLLTYILLVRALEQPSSVKWVLTGVAALVAIYTHFGAIIGLLPSLLFLWVWPSHQPMRKRVLGYLGAIGLVAIGLTPWVIWCFVLIAHPFAVGDSMAKVWEKVPPALAIPKTLLLFSIGHQSDTYPNLAKVYPSLEFPSSLNLAAIALMLALALWVLVPWGDSRLGIPELKKRKALLWLWLAMPLAVLWLVTLSLPLYVVGRYDLIAFPAFVLLLGLALAKLQAQPRVGWILASIAGVLLFSLVGMKLQRYYDLTAKVLPVPSARQTASALASRVKTGDVVAFDMTDGTPVLYYLHRLGFQWNNRECRNPISGLQFGCRIFPPEDEVFYGVPGVPLPLSSFAREVVLSLKGPDNVLWVLVNSGYASDAVFLAELAGLDLEAAKFPVAERATLVALRRR